MRLAGQIVDELREVAHSRALSVAVVHGGVGLERQAKLAARAHIVVATPGRLEDLLQRRDLTLKNVRHLVLDLVRPMSRGETLTFEIERTAMEGFTADEEWLETTIDHPTERLSRAIVFPRRRPCQRAMLHHEGQQTALPVIRLLDGRTLVRFEVLGPTTGAPYTVHWTW